MMTERSAIARGHGGRRRVTAETCWGGENVPYRCAVSALVYTKTHLTVCLK